MTVSWSFLSRLAKLVVVLVLSAMLLLGSVVHAPTAFASGGEVGVDWFDSGAQNADLQDMQNAGVKWLRVGVFF
jgi:arabinogalactan endo-1,4-beta-galactosidase